MNQRHKIMTALSVAAAVAVLCAALALAAGTMLKPRRDNVVAARGRGESTPTHTPVPETTPQPEQALYYATKAGRYYHIDAHCGGMMNAMPIAESDALDAGKQPCPVCTGWDPPVVNVYATAKGKYYHIDKNCSGMKSATRYYTSESAEEAGKARCPVCLPDGDNLCWATSGGQYYHIKQKCMGMKGARICMEASAQRQGKTPCPVCWKGDGRYDP